MMWIIRRICCFWRGHDWRDDYEFMGRGPIKFQCDRCGKKDTL